MFLLLKVIIVNLVIAFLFNLCVADVNESFNLFTGSDNKNKEISGHNENPENDKNESDNSDKDSTDTQYVLDWEEMREKLHASLDIVMRCSRRFYPGVCNEPVVSVWTFSFSYQNCTERLGCRSSSVSNRFDTYASCIYNCRPLIDVYTHILAYHETEKLHDHDHDSDEHMDDFDSSDEDYDEGKEEITRRKGISTLENLISSVKEDYGSFDEPSIPFPETHEGEPPEEIQRLIPQDLDHIDREHMDVNYDFNTGRHRSKRRVRGFD